MNHSVWEKNLQSLERHYPQNANMLRSRHISPPPPPLTEAEVRRWLRQAMSNPVEQVVLLGTRGGYAVQLLHQEYGLRQLVVIEKEFSRLAQALTHVDLSAAIEDPSVFWLVGCPPEQLERGLEYCKTTLAALGFQLLQHPPSWDEASTYYAAVLRELKRIVEHEHFNLKARLARGNLVQRNLVSNLPHALRSLIVDETPGLFTNVPAYIVAAGPSLDKNAAQLKNVGDSGLIFAVDTALKTLLAHDIHPHFAVTTDPTAENAAHFDGIDLPHGCALAFTPDAFYQIIRRYETHSPRLVLFDDSTRLTYYLKDKISLHTVLPRAQHVGETAVRLALALQCNPIILVGMDLALPPEAETTHAFRSARAGRILSRKENEALIQSTEGCEFATTLVEVPGICHATVPTYYSFKMYLERFEQLVKNTPVQWIDATEGGALKLGCHVQPLHEVTQTYGGRDLRLRERIEHLPQIGSDRADILYPTIRRGIDHLEHTLRELDKIARGAIEPQQADAVWMRFLNDSELRTFLDHAVFQFQLYSRPENVPIDHRFEYLQSRAKEAGDRIRLFLPFWRDTLQNLKAHVV